MKTYEITYIITPEITAEEAEGMAKETESFVQIEEGVILKSEKPSAKTLSYPIKKQGSGFFTVLEFQAEPEKLAGISEKIAKNGKILRHFITVKNPAKKLKEKRTRKKLPSVESETAGASALSSPIIESLKKTFFSEEKSAEEKIQKTEETKQEKKVELKDIEQKLEEILGE